MERHGVPNDVITNLNPFSLLIFIPIMDFLVYPSEFLFFVPVGAECH